MRGGADELELTLGRADPPEEPDDRVGRSGARLGADLRRHEAGVGDGDLDPRQGRGRGAGVGDDPLRAPGRDLAHEPHDRRGQVVGADSIVHVPKHRRAGQPAGDPAVVAALDASARAAIDQGATLSQRFDVAALSTLIIVDSDGRVTFRATDPDADTIVSALHKAGA